MNDQEFQSFSDSYIENSIFGVGEIRVGLKMQGRGSGGGRLSRCATTTAILFSGIRPVVGTTPIKEVPNLPDEPLSAVFVGLSAKSSRMGPFGIHRSSSFGDLGYGLAQRDKLSL